MMAFSLGSSGEALGIVLRHKMAVRLHHANPSGSSLEGACLLLAQSGHFRDVKSMNDPDAAESLLG
jgi:hypothetical protein